MQQQQPQHNNSKIQKNLLNLISTSISFLKKTRVLKEVIIAGCDDNEMFSFEDELLDYSEGLKTTSPRVVYHEGVKTSADWSIFTVKPKNITSHFTFLQNWVWNNPSSGERFQVVPLKLKFKIDSINRIHAHFNWKFEKIIENQNNNSDAVSANAMEIEP